ncbi:unnamed protein product [Bursaphelenchus okinawaensis]|uniref:C2H2-type domain-containing protein n=1 Tax=Bursaphelenchus okinawaensis TaxID=465554 RepID=A0A811JWN0_9BILA|nr:unnamed protein product [Bursaphelenchus okinawaensis]CAG9086422.1 unnamed protein product [Bursaphelenchus okinawaensis]
MTAMTEPMESAAAAYAAYNDFQNAFASHSDMLGFPSAPYYPNTDIIYPDNAMLPVQPTIHFYQPTNPQQWPDTNQQIPYTSTVNPLDYDLSSTGIKAESSVDLSSAIWPSQSLPKASTMLLDSTAGNSMLRRNSMLNHNNMILENNNMLLDSNRNSMLLDNSSSLLDRNSGNLLDRNSGNLLDRNSGNLLLENRGSGELLDRSSGNLLDRNSDNLLHRNSGNLLLDHGRRNLLEPDLASRHIVLEEKRRSNQPTKVYGCPTCGKQYCRKSTLKSHIKQHFGNKPFMCNACGKTFTQAANLTAHKRVHTGEKPFTCSVCFRPFSQSSSLVTHKRDGIGMLVNGPELEPEEHKKVVEAIGQRVGLIHQTHFGKIFTVCTKPNASNMAYASGKELPYHTDFPSLSDPPQLQFLHCAQPAQKGGLSMFVDGFLISDILKTDHKWAYDVLCHTNIEFIEVGYDVHEVEDTESQHGKNKGSEVERSVIDRRFDFQMTSQQKTITVRQDGSLKKVQFGNAMRSWAFEAEPEKIQLLYDALKLFTTLCYKPENQLAFNMQKGDSVLWANTRLLHARSAYECPADKPRILQGCYFSWDIVKSRLRLAKSRLGQKDYIVIL